jgi:DNA-directed RNA polymerase specialized sigma24 family protein
VDQQRRRSRHEEQLLSRRHGGERAFGGPEPSASELLEGRYAEEPQPTAADELAELLEWATAEGHLREGEAELIRLYRLGHVSAGDLGAIQGGAPATVERRRQRAEARLVAAVRVA